jgi:hypothetical protein
MGVGTKTPVKSEIQNPQSAMKKSSRLVKAAHAWLPKAGHRRWSKT